MKKWIEYLGDALIIVFGLWSVLTFFLIMSEGYVRFVEHNTPILVTEFILSILIIGVGIERLIDDLKKADESIS